jgi:propanol-preferring alcohol dehydrogenase
MDTMIAYRLLNAQTQPEFQEVPEPHAAPGQVLVKVGGSGLCHTDFTVISRDLSYWKDDPPLFTLGHEIAGGGRDGGVGPDQVPRGSYPLSAVKQAYDDFEHERLVGRAVVIPEGSEASAA